MITRLKLCWLRFKIASYTNDALYLSETAERCKADAVRARAKVEELRVKLYRLCAEIHERRDTLVGVVVIVGAALALLTFGRWS